MAVGKEDDSESESEAVAAITNATRPSRLATQVEQLGKQIETGSYEQWKNLSEIRPVGWGGGGGGGGSLGSRESPRTAWP